MNAYKFIVPVDSAHRYSDVPGFVASTGEIRYSSTKTPVTVGGESYMPVAISRTGYALDSLPRKNNISVMFPGDSKLARHFITPVDVPLSVEISLLTGQLFFRGTLVKVVYDQDNKIEMTFSPTVRIASNVSGERRVFQRTCPYLVYGNNCTASRRRASVYGTIKRVQSVRRMRVSIPQGTASGTSIPLPIGHLDVGWLVGGMISRTLPADYYVVPHAWWITDIQNIGFDAGNIEFDVILFSDHNAAVNERYWFTIGCKRTSASCRDIHNNIDHYGGFVSLTKISPFHGGYKISAARQAGEDAVAEDEVR